MEISMPPHCDTVDGPVVTAARDALESQDVTKVFPWISKDKEKDPAEDLRQLRSLLEAHSRITLVFAARDTEHNNAVALRNYILDGEL